jgi:hypothetical protein
MMATVRKLREKWRAHRERKKRLNAARNANPDYGQWRGEGSRPTGGPGWRGP